MKRNVTNGHNGPSRNKNQRTSVERRGVSDRMCSGLWEKELADW